MSTTPSSTPPTTPKADPLQPNATLPQFGREHWSNENLVNDVTIKVLYRPFSVTGMLLVFAVLAAGAFLLDNDSLTSYETRLRAIYFMIFVFLFAGLLVFPSGPFIRPHPLFWRVVFGLSFLYELFLIFMLFQSREDVRSLFTFFDSSLNQPLAEKQYAANCDITVKTISDAVFDRFFVSHFLGWVISAIMLRDLTICWTISVIWEFIEIGFLHMLPNFKECWWDQWILDVCLTNGVGMFIGHYLAIYLEFKPYTWSGIHSFPTVWGKFQRVFMQFTPESWTRVRWEKFSSIKRFFSVQVFVWFFIFGKLNAFFLKNMFLIPSESYLNVVRLGFMFLWTVPTTRQYYIYSTDPTCKRLGTQAWMLGCIIGTELLVMLKHGRGLYLKPIELKDLQLIMFATAGYILYCAVVVLQIFKRHGGDGKPEEEAKKDQ